MAGVASDSPDSAGDEGVAGDSVGGSGGVGTDGVDCWLALQPTSVSATPHGAKLRIQCPNIFIVIRPRNRRESPASYTW